MYSELRLLDSNLFEKFGQSTDSTKSLDNAIMSQSTENSLSGYLVFESCRAGVNPSKILLLWMMTALGSSFTSLSNRETNTCSLNCLLLKLITIHAFLVECSFVGPILLLLFRVRFHVLLYSSSH